ncbi:MAG: GntR family transcriptional regulator, partial [Thiopseudomonas sp.]
FGVSKGNYKKAIGGLFKQGLIEIGPQQIRSTQG